MKKEISQTTLIAVIAVVVFVLGGIGWFVLNPPVQQSGNPEVLKSAIARKRQREGGP